MSSSTTTTAEASTFALSSFHWLLSSHSGACAMCLLHRAEVRYVPSIIKLPHFQENSEEEIMPVSVTCGSHHTAVITRRGDLISWGMGTSGQTGHGPTIGDVCSPIIPAQCMACLMAPFVKVYGTILYSAHCSR